MKDGSDKIGYSSSIFPQLSAMIYGLIAIGIAVIAFIWWRYTSIERGRRARDEKLLTVLDPIALRLSQKEHVAAEEIAALSRQPEFRPMLYQMLKHFERLDLFPSEDLSIPAQGAGILAYWLLHPNELQAAPAQIELVEEVVKDLDGEREVFLVMRYRAPPGHFAEKDGWLLGLAGPFNEKDVPYSGRAGGFSRGDDKYGHVKPSELIDWYFKVASRKRA